MNEKLLPQGKGAALFDNIKYNVPGLFVCSDLIFEIINIIKKKYNYILPISSMYGSPNFKWNGGRTIVKTYETNGINKKIANELETVKRNGIMPLVTMSNHQLSEDDLNDELGNYILESLNEISGGVIVSSEILRDYIKNKYHNISIHASVIKTVIEGNRTVEYYKNLSNNYDVFVVHPDDNFNIELLKKINLDNAEIMINERCKYNCELRAEHYNSIADEQKNIDDGKISKFMKKCSFLPENKQLNSSSRNISLSITEVHEILKYGAKRIKLQGRADDLRIMVFDLLRYTLENEIAFPSAYVSMFDFVNKYNQKVKYKV